MTSNVESATKEIASDFAILRRDIAHPTEASRGLLDHQTRTAGARASDAAWRRARGWESGPRAGSVAGGDRETGEFGQ